MAIDIGNDFLQRLIVIMQYVLIYIAKAVMWIGLMIVSKQVIDLFTQVRRRDKFATIIKGIIMILLSI
ncbi:MAG: hypothetical protein H7641_07400, partial [Candidatus Heimdallarchaeota archaeon]|nr:hypothetical protein [Candidatus Heimdallarchaeota archaeon]MCK4877388.1 hypothetical protein [Candidatus Heimdallarchaeota archaeon]